MNKFIEFLDIEDKKIVNINKFIEISGIPTIEIQIKQQFPDLVFTHWEDDGADILNVTADNIGIEDHTILNILGQNCIISVDLNIGFSADVRMGDPDSVAKDSQTGDFFFRHYLSGTVSDWINLRAIVKCRLSKDGAQIEAILSFSFVDDVVSIGARPRSETQDDWDEYRQKGII